MIKKGEHNKACVYADDKMICANNNNFQIYFIT